MRTSSLHGFTLVETLVAIAILMIVVVTPFYAADHALIASATARDELLANTLAQQAIENVRSLRDGNYLKAYETKTTVDWMNGLDGAAGCFSPKACTIDINEGGGYVSASSCPVVGGVANCSTLPLYSDAPLSGSFPYFMNQQQLGTRTSFVRTVQLYCGSKAVNQAGCVPSAATEIEVVVTVSWVSGLEGAITHKVEVQDYLDNWLPS